MISLFISLSKSRGCWKVLLVGWILTAALGLWGMRLAPDGRTFMDDIYQPGDLSGLGFSLELGNANWQLQVARWLGPLVAAASLLEGIAAVSRRRSDAWRARRRRDHSIVLGLGDRGPGSPPRWPTQGATSSPSRSTRPSRGWRCCDDATAAWSRATRGSSTSSSRPGSRRRRRWWSSAAPTRRTPRWSRPARASSGRPAPGRCGRRCTSATPACAR